jgi:transcriptional regulator with XRE-family HTH domain
MAESNNSDIIERMKFLRRLQEKAGLNPNQTAVMLGVPPQTYHYWIKSADSIKFTYLARIRKAFGLSWSQLGKLIDAEIAENHICTISKQTRKPGKSGSS